MPKFQPGQSGNPSGRRPGSGKIAQLRKKIERDVPEILTALATAAKAGDVQAARVLLDRTLPTLKAVDAPTPLALGTGPADDLAGAVSAVLAALSVGRLTPDQAGALAGVLSALARIRESTELEERIRALESRQ
jgi:hypothetical protein